MHDFARVSAFERGVGWANLSPLMEIPLPGEWFHDGWAFVFFFFCSSSRVFLRFSLQKRTLGFEEQDPRKAGLASCKHNLLFWASWVYK